MRARLVLLLFAFVPLGALATPPAGVQSVQLPAAAKLPPLRPSETKASPAPLQSMSAQTAVPVPGGSYLRTCRAPRATAAMLHAECEASGGRWLASNLPWPKCAGADISNRNGRLVCLTPRRANWGGSVLPPGSWFDSCWGTVEGRMLDARCRTGSGEVRVLGLVVEGEGVAHSRLSLDACPDGSDIANIRGQLTCIAR
jgi:hypothetical protein